jgi:hypothetical protein
MNAQLKNVVEEFMWFIDKKEEAGHPKGVLFLLVLLQQIKVAWLSNQNKVHTAWFIQFN